jgi:hypothetical protein
MGPDPAQERPEQGGDPLDVFGHARRAGQYRVHNGLVLECSIFGSSKGISSSRWFVHVLWK